MPDSGKISVKKGGIHTSFRITQQGPQMMPGNPNEPIPRHMIDASGAASAYERDMAEETAGTIRPDDTMAGLVRISSTASMQNMIRPDSRDRQEMPKSRSLNTTSNSRFYPQRGQPPSMAAAGVRTPARKTFQPPSHLRSLTSLQPEPGYDSYYGDEDGYGDPTRGSPPYGSRVTAQFGNMGGGGLVPRINHPLRVEPPPEYNAPPRTHRKVNEDDETGESTTPKLPEVTPPTRKTNNPMAQPGLKTKPQRMKDYSMLASACRRAGRTSNAGTLVFNRGVLYDNMGDFHEALKCYKEFLEACLETNDVVGEALACNSIGVDYQYLGGPFLKQALQYHMKHLEVADVPGKFIAHCNLGLCYQGLGMPQEAVANHQHALRYAIRMSSLAGESLACGNLGLCTTVDDAATAKACTERQLQLARTLNDQRGKGDAYQQLGSLANSQGEYKEAGHYFEQAMRIANQAGDEESSNMARCNLGVAQGNLKFEEYLASLAGGD